ncbi:MAG: nicotinate (nicotinamide) nucleotide adenylyltransferase [Gemmataceae bacterium]|nr:nicotinate (nicotinamide) nucleotide adenylyltransferase [Gemmataceae bacterium]
MRVGVFGGSFDPVHLGHLALAEACREAASLDEVWFIPAHFPPHKGTRALAWFEHRLEMLELAIAGHEPFRADPLERERPGPSFTMETLRLLSQQHPGNEWFLILGSDSALEFSTWKEPGKILQMATLVVHGRRGGELSGDFSSNLEKAAGVAPRLIEVHGPPWFDISSTLLRERISQGKSIRFLVPRALEEYIRSKKLYLK